MEAVLLLINIDIKTAIMVPVFYLTHLRLQSKLLKVTKQS